MQFQHHYENIVLDTIHNFFPAMLYEPEIFQTIPDVFAYTRMQMQRHFDLFSAGRAAYQPIGQLRPTVLPNATITRDADLLRLGADFLSALRTPTNFTNAMPTVNMNELLNITVPNNLFTTTFQQRFEDPVVVRPTAQQIAEATSLEIIETGDEDCAICQDTMVEGAEALTIDFCDHTFHQNCISTWFQQNVRCPVCRHDIREEA